MGCVIKQTALCVVVGMALLGTAQAAENARHRHDEMNHEQEMAGTLKMDQTVITARGVVKEIDLRNHKVTIAHEAIPAIDWPAMTMRFTFNGDDSHIQALTPGSHVEFSFIQQGSISLLQSINNM